MGGICRSLALEMMTYAHMQLLLASFATLCHTEFVYAGESGQAVLGCRCKGTRSTHGHCGFHLHFGSHEEKPWCRTMHGCGQSSWRGSWMYCDERGVEKRRADDAKLYNAREFEKHFGKGKDGGKKWE